MNSRECNAECLGKTTRNEDSEIFQSMFEQQLWSLYNKFGDAQKNFRDCSKCEDFCVLTTAKMRNRLCAQCQSYSESIPSVLLVTTNDKTSAPASGKSTCPNNQQPQVKPTKKIKELNSFTNTPFASPQEHQRLIGTMKSCRLGYQLRRSQS